jgi:hypothetical protein
VGLHRDAQEIAGDKLENPMGSNRSAEAVAPEVLPTVQGKLLVDTSAASEFDRSS